MVRLVRMCALPVSSFGSGGVERVDCTLEMIQELVDFRLVRRTKASGQGAVALHRTNDGQTAANGGAALERTAGEGGVAPDSRSRACAAHEWPKRRRFAPNDSRGRASLLVTVWGWGFRCRCESTTSSRWRTWGSR